jgi:hypothetical protein
MRRLALLLLLLPRTLLAAELVLSFDFPDAVKVDSFLVTYRRASDPGGVLQQFRIPYVAPPTCAAIPDVQGPNHVCARTPECLPGGTYTFSVQAERGKETSARSNWFTCDILAGCRYDCAKYAAINDAVTPPDPADPSAPPPEQTPPPPPPPLFPPAGPPAPHTPDRLRELQTELDELKRLLDQVPTPVTIHPT